jgi:tellurite resistance protein TehA-like permease
VAAAELRRSDDADRQARAQPALWSILFPVGMYGVASYELGQALHVSWLVTLGGDEAWLALAVWVVVFAAMLGSFAGALARNPARAARRPRHSP